LQLIIYKSKTNLDTCCISLVRDAGLWSPTVVRSVYYGSPQFINRVRRRRRR